METVVTETGKLGTGPVLVAKESALVKPAGTLQGSGKIAGGLRLEGGTFAVEAGRSLGKTAEGSRRG